jgi:hypothetical protein
MDHFVIQIRQDTSWLYNQIYENQFFFIDFWSLCHLWSGFVFFAILLTVKCKHPWKWLIVFLSLYEIIEISMIYISLHVFNPETIKDQFTDILVGILGGILFYLLAKQKAKKTSTFFEKVDIESIFVAETLSFLSIGSSQFFFFQPDKEDALSFVNYLWRILLCYIILRIYVSFKRISQNSGRGLLVLTMGYFVLYILSGVLTGSYAYHDLLELFFGDMRSQFKGSYLLYQLCFPFLVILFYEAIFLIFNKEATDSKQVTISPSTSTP